MPGPGDVSRAGVRITDLTDLELAGDGLADLSLEADSRQAASQDGEESPS